MVQLCCGKAEEGLETPNMEADCVHASAKAGLDHGPDVLRAEGGEFLLHTDSDNTVVKHFRHHHYFSHVSILDFLFLVTFS